MILTGCSTIQLTKTEKSPELAETLISQDLINVLIQVRALNSERVALAVPDDAQLSDQFGKTLVDNFKNAGYTLRNAISDSHTRPVSYTVNQAIGAENGAVYTYTVNVGDVSVRRTYRPLADGSVTPVSDMQIRGASAANFIINNDLFNRSKASGNDDLIAKSAPVSTPASDFSSSAISETTDQNAAAKSGAVAFPTAERLALKSDPTTSVAGVRTQRKQDYSEDFFSNSTSTNSNTAKQNVRNLGESNFANILNAYGTVEEAVLIFANDSTVLGSGNKARVGEFVSQFDAANDVFSVIGCSHGPTAVSGGQESLSLGRAQRVKEALMFAGVPENNILDEGCWDHEQFDKRMPRRGVVLALKRRV